MKSAYELAMERLQRESGPMRSLTDGQRAAINEIDKRYEARIAELRLQYDQQFSEAKTAEELAQMQAGMAAALAALEEKRDSEKDAIWEQA